MKPRPGGVRSRLAHSTVLLAVCLVVGSTMMSMSPVRPAGDPPGPSAFAAAGQHRVAPLAGRLGGDEEHWSAPQPHLLAAQAAEQQAASLAHVPKQSDVAPAESSAEAEEEQDEADAEQRAALAPPEQAQQAHAQAAGTAAVADLVDKSLQQRGDQPQAAAAQQQQLASAQDEQAVMQQQDQEEEEEEQQQQSAEPEQPAEQQPAGHAPDVQARQQALQQAQQQDVETQQEAVTDDIQQQQQQQQQQTAATQGAQQEPQQAPRPAQQQRRQLRCAVINNVSTHLDVAAGLAWALQEAGCSVTCYLHHATQGIQDVMSQWYRGQYSPMEAVLQDAPQYDVLVVATMSLPPAPASQGLKEIMLGQPQRPALAHQRIALVVHNPDHLLLGLPLWVPGMLLSQAVQLGTEAPVAGAGTIARKAQRAAAAAAAGQAAAGGQGAAAAAADKHAALVGLGAGGPNRPMRHLCIQGAIDPRRRDYDSFFEAASHPAVLAELKARGERLLLVGHKPRDGLPPMPECTTFLLLARTAPACSALAGLSAALRAHPSQQHLHDYVEVAADLVFEMYYNTLASCRAILTAFGSDAYVLNKTSSTVAAAIHLEVPLLTEERVLDAYPFLTRAAAFVYDSGRAAPNVAKLARAAARQGTPAVLARAIRTSIAAGATGRRRLWTAEHAAAAAAEDGAALAAEAAGGGAAAGSHPSSTSGGGSTQQQEVLQAADTEQQQRPQQHASAAPASSGEVGSSGAATEATAGAATAAGQGPPAGSYAAALLAAFNDQAVRAARQAARELKAQLMRHNLEVAGALLSETAAAAAAAHGR
ncbi:hypothetical protein COHA_004092 [Chlorella ohadii]|uniref:Uncharacterized protein n=1 Tax=Chlorella ohadii TaxID=2649997 RepID=A0AAD5DTZ1_9CHLO|nr:hypothetical protein COHA_004092 [Chlorella ohadii]